MGKTTDVYWLKLDVKTQNQGKQLLRFLKNAENPLSAEDIFLCIKKQGSSVNLSTVYRTLDLMESKSVVNKIVMMDGKARYELTVDGHRHHLVCTNCHKSVPIDFCPLENMEKDIGMRSDFDITGHKIEIYGICPNCKKE